MRIEELFGTLQQSVVSGWRKHLRTHKYSEHMALDEFYKEMPEKVDALIEAWMGANNKKVNSFDNIIVSKNMGTLAYLKELKRVCKEGRSLMNGEPDLESLLDDIVELINSTLYKVKELNENKMISLQQLVEESLVNEAKTINCVAFWDHYNPSELYCVEDVDESFVMRVADATDWNTSHLSGSHLVSIMWNDESLFCSDVPGNNLNDAKKKDLKNIENQLKKQEGSDGVYIESDIFGGGNEWYGDDVPKTAQETLDRFIEIIEHSEVDGDSGYARALVDLKTCKVLLGSDNISFMDADDFLEMVGIEED